jgi:hypothetical protein
MIRRGHARSANAKGFRELDEIRIDEVGRHHAAVKTFALVAADIAIGVVVEHQRHHADLELHGSRQFLHAEHEAAVTGDGDHRPVRVGDLGAERGGEARAERALIARGDEGARLVDRKAVPGSEADL